MRFGSWRVPRPVSAALRPRMLSSRDWEKTRSKPNPLANDRDAPVAGAKLFREHCAECHGAAGEGGKGAPRLINNELRRATPGEIFWVITNGVIRHGMPSWSKLPPLERWQIVAFLKGLNGSQK